MLKAPLVVTGTALELLPSAHLTWKAWKEKHPQGEVLSTDTGHPRNYGGEAYASYFKSPDTMFPVPQTRDELPKKDWVIGVIADEFGVVARVGERRRPLRHRVQGRQVVLVDDEVLGLAVVQDVIQFAAGIGDVDGHHHGAKAPDCKPGERKLGQIGHHDRHMRALADPQAVQGRGNAVRPGLHLPVGRGFA